MERNESAVLAQRLFLSVSALVFAISATVTVVWCASMSAMGGMEMPGGWTMSMAWMPMPGKSWLAAAASFLGMWIVMMVAMMLPSLVPILGRYRGAGVARETHAGSRSALVALGYFCVWTAAGALVFTVGVALAALEMQSPALARGVPLAAGGVVLVAGALQLTAWKAQQLGCCRPESAWGERLAPAARTAWQQGARLGRRCIYCCGNLIAILLVMGVMNLWAMTAIMAGISLERLAPRGERVARAIGVVAIAAGLLLIVRRSSS